MLTKFEAQQLVEVAVVDLVATVIEIVDGERLLEVDYSRLDECILELRGAVNLAKEAE